MFGDMKESKERYRSISPIFQEAVGLGIIWIREGVAQQFSMKTIILAIDLRLTAKYSGSPSSTSASLSVTAWSKVWSG